MALARVTKFFAGRVKISGFEFPSRFIRGPEPYAETDQRDLFQSIAPEVQDGLYLVPRVIE